ncbi:MAG TPA: hypothetical protein VJ869_02410, partial [Sphaerochaeta sp.]|nr:hypothetical protein [Sphaerochaeta sp.]
LLHDDLSYYPKLKASYDHNEWGEVLDGLLDELERRSDEKSSSVFRKNPYPEVLKAEAKYKRLLTYIQKNPSLVQIYQDVLLPTYKDAVFELYRKNILSDGEAATSRNAYKALALLLKELVVIGGGSVAEQCLTSLEPRYSKRSAMRNEIEKVGLL